MYQAEFDELKLAEPVIAYNNKGDNNPFFIDPLEDRWFKRLFGAAQNKELTIAFLNHVLKGKRQVVNIETLKNEYPGEIRDEGSATVDVICKDENGKIFLIEIQKKRHKNFKERSLFYASRLISEQAPHGNRKDWGYVLKDVYVICLLEKFIINTGRNKQQWMHDVVLSNPDTGTVFNESLRFTYLELISFKKAEGQLKTDLEKWIYALKNLKLLKQIPATFTEPQLVQFCEAARYINLKGGKRYDQCKNKSQMGLLFRN